MATSKALTVTDRVKELVREPSIDEQFSMALGDKKGLFLASMVSLVSGDEGLKKCNPNQIVVCCLQAATLGLTVSKALGHAYIVPFKDEATFIIGYKGLIQLALKTKQYRHINADIVYEGERVAVDRLRGTIEITGEATSTKPIGYFAFIELIDGFEAAVYMTVAQVHAHAQQYSASYRAGKKIWKSDFDAMAKKTCLRKVFKYGYLSIEMQDALAADEPNDIVGNAERGKQVDENSEPIEGSYTVIDDTPTSETTPTNEDEVPF